MLVAAAVEAASESLPIGERVFASAIYEKEPGLSMVYFVQAGKPFRAMVSITPQKRSSSGRVV